MQPTVRRASFPRLAAARSRRRPAPSFVAHLAACLLFCQKSSYAWARRAGSARNTAPRALYGSAAMLGCFSHQSHALTYHPPTSISDQTGRGRRAKLLRARWWPAVMTPRDGELRADDVAASRRAANGAGPSIEAARTCAHGDRRGAVVGFAACRTASHIISGGERQSHRPLLFPSKFFHYLVLWSSSPASYTQIFAAGDFRSIDAVTMDKARRKDTSVRRSNPCAVLASFSGLFAAGRARRRLGWRRPKPGCGRALARGREAKRL